MLTALQRKMAETAGYWWLLHQIPGGGIVIDN